jgi:hypothetical protein
MLLVIAVLAAAWSCSQQDTSTVSEDPAAQAWEALGETWNQAETAAEKTALAEAYLSDYPDTEHSGTLAGAITYYRGGEMGDAAGALDVLQTALEHIEDPEQRFEVTLEALSLSNEVEVPYSLAETAAALAATRPLAYLEHDRLAELAIDLEEWEVAAEHAQAAVELATPEGYRADYPDREYTDEELTSRAERRRALSLAYAGWARYNLGQVEEAFARFAASDEIGSIGYTGVPNTPLYEFWGRAALREGELDSAIELLGTQAIFGEDGSGAMPYLRDAYAAKNGDDSGFEEFLWATRNELAPTVDDFELLDYEGNPFRLSDVGDRVVLLAFWFPT